MRRGREVPWPYCGVEALHNPNMPAENFTFILKKVEEAKKFAFPLLLFSISPYNFNRI
jgi:hypothetical protein